MTASTERLPDFFVVGHPKSGTTALYEMLRAHPQVFMPELKEPRFFGADVYSPADAPPASGLPRTLAEYLALFAPARADQLVGEASPLYLTSRLAAGEIAEHRPDARVIAIVREPASFLRSLHLQFVQSRHETVNDLRRAIEMEQSRRQGRRVPGASEFRAQALFYSDYVRYVEQLRRYREAFAPEQVLVLIYEEFRQDNAAAVRQVLRFLGLDDTIEIEPREANPTVRVRSVRLDRLVHSLSVGRSPASRALKAPLKALAPRGVRRRALYTVQSRMVYDRPEDPELQLMAELRARFRPEVAALGEYLGRDLLTLWGYDRID